MAKQLEARTWNELSSREQRKIEDREDYEMKVGGILIGTTIAAYTIGAVIGETLNHFGLYDYIFNLF